MAPQEIPVRLNLGRWTAEVLTAMIETAHGLASVPEMIGFISSRFLDIPYAASTLVGSPEEAEALVFNLAGVDCFTYIDCVEAMRLSRNFDEAVVTLRHVRYKSGIVSYKNRKHFFSDWFSSPHLIVATASIGENRVISATKNLNQKEAGDLFLAGIRPMRRTIEYIPSPTIDRPVLTALQTGDYIGIYTNTDGLDVSHVGIFVESDKGRFLRHASSLAGKVVDQDFFTYCESKPGIVVLRPVG
jgi:hypothetical protein